MVNKSFLLSYRSDFFLKIPDKISRETREKKLQITQFDGQSKARFAGNFWKNLKPCLSDVIQSHVSLET